MNPICDDCMIEYSPKRRELGYRTCLDCGSTRALKEMNRRKKCVAPAFNKGAYQYVGSIKTARSVGR